MPGTTDPRGYPYPLDADPVDVALDIRRLADAIDNDVGAVEGNILKVYNTTSDMQANAPRIAGHVVNVQNGEQWRFDGTRWVLTYSPPGAWQVLALTAPTVALGAPVGPLAVRQNNGYLEFRGGAKCITLTTNNAICQLPAGFLPEAVEAINPSARGMNSTSVLWSTQVTVPNTTAGYVSAAAQASSGGSLPQPFYGDVEFGFGGIRLWMPQRTLP